MQLTPEIEDDLDDLDELFYHIVNAYYDDIHNDNDEVSELHIIMQSLKEKLRVEKLLQSLEE